MCASLKGRKGERQKIERGKGKEERERKNDRSIGAG